MRTPAAVPGATSEVAPEALHLLDVPFDSALAQQMVAEVQAEYVTRYGGPDATPLTAAQFAPPGGAFLVALWRGEPVGSAGLRAAGEGVVELKRMYVRTGHRRRGHARALLAAVEERARSTGHRRLVLETGARQPEAVALYTSAGYTPVEPFGHYACSEHSIHLGKDL